MNPVEKAQRATENSGKNSGKKRRGRRENLRPWQPGQSGNPGGRPKKKPVTEIFEELLEAGTVREEIKNQVRRTLTSRGMAGVLMLREAAERVEGKVPQAVEAELNVKVTLEQVLAARTKAGK